jgi:hypothetical protein
MTGEVAWIDETNTKVIEVTVWCRRNKLLIANRMAEWEAVLGLGTILGAVSWP